MKIAIIAFILTAMSLLTTAQYYAPVYSPYRSSYVSYAQPVYSGYGASPVYSNSYYQPAYSSYYQPAYSSGYSSSYYSPVYGGSYAAGLGGGYYYPLKK